MAHPGLSTERGATVANARPATACDVLPVQEPGPVYGTPPADAINHAIVSPGVQSALPAIPVDPRRCGPTDSLAIASAVFGFTAIIPVISQVAGLGLGIASLLRIRRANREGRHVRGRGWAVAGIVSSSVILVGWLAALGALIAVSAYFVQAADALPALDAAMQ